jgi:outer membrane protein assembly factor BamB
LLAWDPVKQKEAWHFDYPGLWNGGILTTAGNLVVQGNATGALAAYRADTGQKLWSMSTQSAVMELRLHASIDRVAAPLVSHRAGHLGIKKP